MKFILLFLLFLFFIACSEEIKEPLHMPTLTNDGVGSLNSKTLFKESAIAPNLLGYEITKLSAFTNGASHTLMRVTYHGKEVMYITPTKPDANTQPHIQSISITSDYVNTPFESKIKELYKQENFSTCQKTSEEIICKQKNFNNIKFIFKKEHDNQVRLAEIVWSKDD